MGETGEVFVADGAAGFVVGMGEPPQPQVDGLFRRGEIGQELIEHVPHTTAVWRTMGEKSRVQSRELPEPRGTDNASPLE